MSLPRLLGDHASIGDNSRANHLVFQAVIDSAAEYFAEQTSSDRRSHLHAIVMEILIDWFSEHVHGSLDPVQFLQVRSLLDCSLSASSIIEDIHWKSQSICIG